MWSRARLARSRSIGPGKSACRWARSGPYKPDDQIKTLSECLNTLVRVVGSGGNLLLNVGPSPDGLIDPAQMERMLQIGDWLRRLWRRHLRHAGRPFRPGSWGASTHRGKSIYLHILDPQIRQIHFPVINAQIESAVLLGGGEVTFAQSDKSIQVAIQPMAEKAPPWSVRLDLDAPSPGMLPSEPRHGAPRDWRCEHGFWPP